MTKLLGPSRSISVTAAHSRVVAGEALPVTVGFLADQALEIASGDVELVRTTAVTRLVRNWTGAGNKVSLRSSAVLSRVRLEIAGPLSAGQRLERQIRLAVPPEEATIAGRLVQQDYVLRARVRVQAGRDAETDSPVLVVSAASGCPCAPDEAPVTVEAGTATLGIEEVSDRRLSAGIPMIGVVTVAPLHAGTARGIQVELVLDEHVPARSGEPLEEDRDATTVVATVALTDHVRLEPGHVLRFPFTLEVPERLPSPSVSTPEFTVRWLLRAVLDRPMRPDPTTTIELCGTTSI
jgi:hypothetical protein